MAKETWNYRIIKMADKKLKGLPQSFSWGIYEVYYKNDVPHSWSENPMHAIGDSWNELMEDYNIMFHAFTKPTLILKEGKLLEIGRFK